MEGVKPEPLPDLYGLLGLKQRKHPKKRDVYAAFARIAREGELPHPLEAKGKYAADIYGAVAVLTDDTWREFYDEYQCMPTTAHRFYQAKREEFYDIAVELHRRAAASAAAPPASSARRKGLEDMCDMVDGWNQQAKRVYACIFIAAGICIGYNALMTLWNKPPQSSRNYVDIVRERLQQKEQEKKSIDTRLQHGLDVDVRDSAPKQPTNIMGE